MSELSLTRSKAGVLSRHADSHEFRMNAFATTTAASFVAKKRPLGAPSASQTKLGIFWPTVQGAIDDLVGRSDLPIGTIIMNDTSAAPTFIRQSEQMKLTGTVTGSIDPAPEPKMIKFLGFPVMVEAGDTDVLVAGKIYTEFVNLIASGEAPVTSLEIDSGDPTILNITYNDCQDHVFPEEMQSGILFEQTITVQALQFYGEWEWLGGAEHTLVGGSVNGPLTLHYFKRTS